MQDIMYCVDDINILHIVTGVTHPVDAKAELEEKGIIVMYATDDKQRAQNFIQKMENKKGAWS